MWSDRGRACSSPPCVVKKGSGARKLQLDGNPDVAGDQTKNFKPAAPFKFLAPHD